MIETKTEHIDQLEKHLSEHPTSPLFARLANIYLENGKAEKALEVCDRGLDQFPFYVTGHLIKGKTLASLGRNAEASLELQMVVDFYPQIAGDLKVLDLLRLDSEKIQETDSEDKKEVSVVKERVLKAPTHKPEIKEEAREVETVNKEDAAGENVTNRSGKDDPFGIETSGVSEEDIEIIDYDHSETTRDPFDLFVDRIRMELGGTENTISLKEFLESDPLAERSAQERKDSIEEFAQKLQAAKRIVPDRNYSGEQNIVEEEPEEETTIATPTLAEIFFKQGRYDAAIKMYEALVVNKPNEAEKFRKRIAEIEKARKGN